MLPAKHGAIIIWNDIAPEGRDEFYAWHLHEHIPERLNVPGFLRGSRFIAATPETKPEFLTLYETESADIATSAPYLERLNAPTSWTKSATSHFRNTSRALTTTIADFGCGLGGVVGTIRFDGSPSGIEACRDAASSTHLMEAAAKLPRISRVRLCMTNLEASEERTTESRTRTDILAAPSGAILIEGCDDGAVTRAMNLLRAPAAIAVTCGIYSLEHQLF